MVCPNLFGSSRVYRFALASFGLFQHHFSMETGGLHLAAGVNCLDLDWNDIPVLSQMHLNSVDSVRVWHPSAVDVGMPYKCRRVSQGSRVVHKLDGNNIASLDIDGVHDVHGDRGVRGVVSVVSVMRPQVPS